MNKVASSCFYHLRRLKHIRRLVRKEVTAQLVLVFIVSRLDYCNALLEGLPRATMEPLQWVQNAAACLLLNLRLRYHVTPALKQLHWLPISSRINFQTLLADASHPHRSSTTVPDRLVQPVTISCNRHLRSSETADYVKWTTRTKCGERGFSYCGPAAWNGLLPRLRTITNTNTFKRHFKSCLFIGSFSQIVSAPEKVG